MHQVDGNGNGMIEIPEFLTMFMSKMNQVWTQICFGLNKDTKKKIVRNKTKNYLIKK